MVVIVISTVTILSKNLTITFCFFPVLQNAFQDVYLYKYQALELTLPKGNDSARPSHSRSCRKKNQLLMSATLDMALKG